MQYLLSKDELDSLNGEKKLHEALEAYHKAVSNYGSVIVEAARDCAWDDGKRIKSVWSAANAAGLRAAYEKLGIHQEPR